MTDDTSWKPCTPGTIQEVANQQKQTEESQMMNRRAAFGLVATIGAGLSYAVWNQTGRTTAQITCSQVESWADDFINGRLDSDKVVMLKAHCQKCPPCAEHLAEMIEENSSQAV